LSCQAIRPDTIVVLTLLRQNCPAKGVQLYWDRTGCLQTEKAARLGFDQDKVRPVAFSKITPVGNGEQICHAVTGLGHEGGYRISSSTSSKSAGKANPPHIHDLHLPVWYFESTRCP
jgi:hypothetical protein